ncbi:cation channel family transporter (macronuclear) [Tetrahymena thermophila SB210]|uniref:Cation channel family transporter n=1 Tax=Tetrahymena thermophila (strain SB210) TaxID=312017 RepID=Q23G13_TETTS|nr:cation channel family transporter [Tetrahymena thermophila SB210]EAR95447.2 cation channel family transporter [Tetrahymena thermophila SB210]|eukprot:XP_001015692.2 cation channel family transporter [Tetrahymena thermophila SB210]
MNETSENKNHLHTNQQLFLKERETDDAFKLRQKNMSDDISIWTDSSKNSANYNADFQNSQEYSKSINILKLKQNSQSIQQENSIFFNEEDITQYKEQKFNNDITALSKKNNISTIKSVYKQNLMSPSKNCNINESKMEISQSTMNNKHQTLKNCRQYTTKVLSNHIKLTIKLKQKFSYFFKAFTMAGRSQALNSTIRSFINDKSDRLGQNSKISAYLRSIFWIQSIKIIDCQSNIGIIISFFFIAFNCLFLFQQSFYIVFQGFLQFHAIFCKISSFLWVIEIVIKLNTSIYINSRQVVERQEIIFCYVKSKLIFDLLPLIIVINASQNTLINIIIFLKIVNIISELNQFYKFLFRVVRQYYLIALINLIIKMFLIAHILACLWYLLALYEYDQNLESESWIKKLEIEGVWWKLYFQALYWALTLMTTGSNEATTNLQRIFTSIIMIFTAIVFGYLLNVVGFILEAIDEKNEKKRRDINILNEFMRSKHISQSLQARINLNLENYYDMNFNKAHKKSQQVLDKISIELKNSLMKEFNRKLINKITFLTKNFSQETLDKLSLVAKEECYLPSQVICNLSKNHDSALIYVISGQAEIQRTNKDQSYVDISNLKVNQGEIIDPTNLFTGLSQPFQAISTQFTQIKDQIQYYQLNSVIGLKCKFCCQSTHYIYDCPFLHFGKQMIYSKIGLKQKQEQNRQHFERRTKYMRTLLIQNTDPTLLQFQEDHQFSKNKETLTSIGVTILLNDDVATNSEYDDKQNEEILQQRIEFTVIEEDDEKQIDYSPSIRELNHQQQSPILTNNLLNSLKTQRINTFTQYLEDQELASPVKIQLSETQAKSSRESYKQLKVNTHKRFNSLQDNSKDTKNPEQEVNYYYQKKSLFSQINSDILNRQQSTQSINESEDSKQKNQKKREVMKYPIPLNRKLLAPLLQQFINQQYDQHKSNEQEYVQFNPWEFDQLKDWNYYFKYGNSKYVLLKHNKYQQMKAKQILRKSPYKRVKNDD